MSRSARSSRMPSPKPPLKLYSLRDAPSHTSSVRTDSDLDPTYKYNNDVAIVIDNGTWQTRAGFSLDAAPRVVCPPLVSRYRDRKALKTYTVCGYDVYADPNARGQARTPFDSNVVSNFDQMETLLDYCFIKLGVGDGQGVGHPLIMTEAVCNPTYSRRMMTELLFEGYNAPSVAFGIDSLFSYNYNKGHTGLVISSSHTATHLIPVVEGKGLVNLATRLNWGGAHSADYMLKLIQLKYPNFPAKLQGWHAEALMKDHCYVSGDYKEEVSNYLKRDVLEEKDRVVQFPFTEVVKVEKSQEELDRIAERRKESGRKLQEQAAKIRLEKLIKKEQELEYFKDLQSRSETENKRDYKRLLESNDFRDEAQLEKTIRELDKSIRRARKQDVGPEEENESPPTFPLLDIPDDQLDDESKKTKRHQKLMKSNHDARQRAKAEKEAEKQRILDEAQRDLESRERDLDSWLEGRRKARESLLARIKDRQRLKTELSDRKSLASQMRMKSIANLASDSPPAKKRRRGGGAGAGGGDDDNFGANDDDWSVYRSIGTGGGAAEEEEDEEEELAKELRSIESQLLLHDPNFSELNTHDAQSDWTNSLIHAFLRGTRPFEPDDQAEAHRIHLNVERVRVPEVLFEPAMAGLDQSGIVEIAANILLDRLPPPTSDRALRDVFLTGGTSHFRGFDDRLRSDLTSLLPAGSPLKVRAAADPILDAWRGAANWEWKDKAVTREEYKEMGVDYIKEHRLGNAFGS